MRARVLFFGILKEIVGVSAEETELPEGASLRTVFDHYAERHPRLKEMAPSIVVARNQEFAALPTLLAEGDEVAFLPPVSGGSDAPALESLENTDGGHYFALTRQ